jgi:hypothetical protein
LRAAAECGAEALRALRTAFGRYLDLPASDLGRAMTVKTLDAMARQGIAAMAARTAAYGKAAHSWAVKRVGDRSKSFANLPIAPPQKRERVLSDDDSLRSGAQPMAPSPLTASCACSCSLASDATRCLA